MNSASTSKVVAWLDAQSCRNIHQNHNADCVVRRVPRWNWSSTILLAWTLSHITNLMMKTESVSGASVGLKKLSQLLAQDAVCWSTSNVKSWKITRMSINASYISVLIGMRLHFVCVFNVLFFILWWLCEGSMYSYVSNVFIMKCSFVKIRRYFLLNVT
jgi:hypothetical protein